MIDVFEKIIWFNALIIIEYIILWRESKAVNLMKTDQFFPSIVWWIKTDVKSVLPLYGAFLYPFYDLSNVKSKQNIAFQMDFITERKGASENRNVT